MNATEEIYYIYYGKKDSEYYGGMGCFNQNTWLSFFDKDCKYIKKFYSREKAEETLDHVLKHFPEYKGKLKVVKGM